MAFFFLKKKDYRKVHHSLLQIRNVIGTIANKCAYTIMNAEIMPEKDDTELMVPIHTHTHIHIFISSFFLSFFLSYFLLLSLSHKLLHFFLSHSFFFLLPHLSSHNSFQSHVSLPVYLSLSSSLKPGAGGLLSSLCFQTRHTLSPSLLSGIVA